MFDRVLNTETLTRVFSCKVYGFFKNTLFTEHQWETAWLYTTSAQPLGSFMHNMFLFSRPNTWIFDSISCQAPETENLGYFQNKRWFCPEKLTRDVRHNILNPKMLENFDNDVMAAVMKTNLIIRFLEDLDLPRSENALECHANYKVSMFINLLSF